MSKKQILELQKASRFISSYITREYGKGCPDFTWRCFACHAHFVKDALRDFVDDQVDLEKWEQGKKTTPKKGHRLQK